MVTVEAYKCDECEEINLTHGGTIYWECSCGDDGCVLLDSHGRAHCSCGRFVKKASDTACKTCIDEHYPGDPIGIARKIVAVKCEKCGGLVEQSDYEDHLSYHD